ncbi:ComEC/Rec2 family competence protein [Sulfitobacter sp. D35]|uniref:ComEC/Rec2 family competence protein n=1 Tax=Sulfitobacter sp. D35 TaxID=3083252 RepID=UPI00296E638C|nr:ComEC/Rec2 family competence protein [Sulfitobacter sp. D35]MDW4497535.1 ComEC/Rec2 family competence protein [Sulfitobacter sp. D35]
MRGSARIEATLLRQRGYLFEWVPVCLGCGIGVFFLLRFEPSPTLLTLAALAALALAALSPRLGEAAAPLALALAVAGAGFVVAGLRTHQVAAPVLNFRYYGPVEGRVVAIDRSGSDALRLTLDRVQLERVSAARTPDRVRVSLHGERSHDVAAVPGLRVMTTAHLSPPGGPVEPGGFDFQRHAWFEGLGAVGYSRVPLLAIAPASEGLAGLAVFRIRMALSEHVRSVLPGDAGGFAAAVTTGDRSAISQAALEDLRASNLAHLLAISGLHMGLLSGFVFGLLRLTLAAIPPVALRWPTRKIAAGGALVAATGYLLLSGASVATERAYIMAAVALSAVMLDRRAISLRAVAIAATIVLVLRPEALTGPGFQMSFSATTALVAIFGWIRDARVPMGPKWLRPVLAVVISSAVAGLATAPIGAAHFNAVSRYGLLANLVSVPVMGTLVVPAAVLAALLAPLGLDWLGLGVMELGLRWILGVAETVAGFDGARRLVPKPGTPVLPLLALGLLWALLWRGRGRVAGAVPVVLAVTLWTQAERPFALVAENGALVGVMTPEGRALSKPRGAGFVAENWLENDGDGADQAAAAQRWPAEPARPASFGAVSILHLSGKRAASQVTRCAPDQVVVASVPLTGLGGGCTVLDPARLRATGAVALVWRDGTPVLRTAREVTGQRVWSGWKKVSPRGQ